KPETMTAALERGLVRMAETGLILDLPGTSDALLNSAVRNKEVELDIARRVGSTTDIGNTLVQTAIEFGIYDYGALLLNLNARQSPVWKVETERVVDAVTKLIAVDKSPGRLGRALVALRSPGKDASSSASLWLPELHEMRPQAAPALRSSIKPRIPE